MRFLGRQLLSAPAKLLYQVPSITKATDCFRPQVIEFKPSAKRYVISIRRPAC